MKNQRRRVFNGGSMVMRRITGKAVTPDPMACVAATIQPIPSAAQVQSDKKRQRDKLAADLQKSL